MATLNSKLALEWELVGDTQFNASTTEYERCAARLPFVEAVEASVVVTVVVVTDPSGEMIARCVNRRRNVDPPPRSDNHRGEQRVHRVEHSCACSVLDWIWGGFLFFNHVPVPMNSRSQGR